MDLTDLQLFIRVAEMGSFSGAARERDVPVSQVSRSLARLEAQHKTRLLHRSTHALSLTEAGQALLEHGKRMLESYAQFEADVSTGAQLAGSVQVACSPAMAQYVSRAHVASLNGALGLPVALARAASPLLLGLLWTPQVGYAYGLGLLLVLSLLGVGALILAQRVSLCHTDV